MRTTTHAGPTRRITIEFLYLDRSRCTRCQQTDAGLEEALAEVARELGETGIAVDVRKIHVRTEEQARTLGFVSSPTIRIDGRDIAPDIHETACASCSCGCETEGVACRVWTYQGQEYDAPPKDLIVDAIRQAVSNPGSGPVETVGPQTDVPENLKRFFATTRREESARSNVGC